MRLFSRVSAAAALALMALSHLSVSVYAGPVSIEPVVSQSPVAIGSEAAGVTSLPFSSTQIGEPPLRAAGGLPGVDALAMDANHPAIPLPAAAWTGIAGLLALGIAKGRGTFRRLIG